VDDGRRNERRPDDGHHPPATSWWEHDLMSSSDRTPTHEHGQLPRALDESARGVRRGIGRVRDDACGTLAERALCTLRQRSHAYFCRRQVTALPAYGGMRLPRAIGAVVLGEPTTFQTPDSGHSSPVCAVVPSGTRDRVLIASPFHGS
jgi:hypothetical protein